MIDGELRNASGERLDHAARAVGDDDATVLVVAHGVTSSHARPYLFAIADAAAEVGVAPLLVTYAGNGASEGRFEDCTISKEVDDLGAVLDALDGRRVAYAGHSMGAAVGVLRAADDARIGALVSLAGMVHVRAFFDRHFGSLAPGEPMLGRTDCPLSPALLDDAARLGDVLDAAARVRCPWLLVHGTADELVPHADSLDAARAADGRPEVALLEGVDHRFTGADGEVARRVAAWVAAEGPV